MNHNEPNYGQLPTSSDQPPTSLPQQTQSSNIPAPSFSPTASQHTHTGNNNPYSFITDSAPSSRKKHALNGGKPLKLFALVGGLTVVFIAVIFVVMSIFFKGESPQGLMSIVQEQQELIRIANIGEQQSVSDATKNLAYSAALSVGTSQSELLGYMTKHGTKIDPKLMDLKKDPSTDSLLANAKATSTFDSAFQKVLARQLRSYTANIQQAYSSAKSPTLKQVLASSYRSGKALLDQVNTALAQTDMAQ